MNTPYAELSESEQTSDQHQADKFLAVLEPCPEEGCPRGAVPPL